MNKEVGTIKRTKIKTFRDLDAWQEAHKVVLTIYKITQRFPTEEQFGLTSQLRRAAISISSNIAEGFSRPSYKDKVRFYGIAQGSVTEVQSQLSIARDIGYIGADTFDAIEHQMIKVHKIINGLIKGAKTVAVHNS